MKPKIEQPIMFDLDQYLKDNPHFIQDRSICPILISYYMNGTVGVDIISKNPIPEDLITQIERIQSRLLLNWNTSRINSRHLLIKNLFTETPENFFQEEIPRYLRESFIILLGMIEDMLTAVEEKKYNILNDLPERDDKIDRYYFFVVRQIRNFFENPYIKKPLNYSHKKLIDLRLLAKFIEDCGDLLKESANILSKLHIFLETMELRDYIIIFFKALKDAYSHLYDLLNKTVTSNASQELMDVSILPWIQESRNHGKELQDMWNSFSPKLSLLSEEYSFKDYYDGSLLISSMQALFLKIYDFTNILS